MQRRGQRIRVYLFEGQVVRVGVRCTESCVGGCQAEQRCGQNESEWILYGQEVRTGLIMFDLQEVRVGLEKFGGQETRVGVERLSVMRRVSGHTALWATNQSVCFGGRR